MVLLEMLQIVEIIFAVDFVCTEWNVKDELPDDLDSLIQAQEMEAAQEKHESSLEQLCIKPPERQQIRRCDDEKVVELQELSWKPELGQGLFYPEFGAVKLLGKAPPAVDHYHDHGPLDYRKHTFPNRLFYHDRVELLGNKRKAPPDYYDHPPLDRLKVTLSNRLFYPEFELLGNKRKAPPVVDHYCDHPPLNPWELTLPDRLFYSGFELLRNKRKAPEAVDHYCDHPAFKRRKLAKKAGDSPLSENGMMVVEVIKRHPPDFANMIQDYHGVRPTLAHYDCLADPMRRTGLFGQAVELIDTMPFEPDLDDAPGGVPDSLDSRYDKAKVTTDPHNAFYLTRPDLQAGPAQRLAQLDRRCSIETRDHIQAWEMAHSYAAARSSTG
ncbi:hypothetical protein SELMODRAFT_405946 [Selaginella moellendorffii]|uniref:Uncharacterized protein n=1 Tax=Selaginella moellendorffii TaxID=88036 RepID=D8R061_SELML|nr:hypothetical protein SELMODRAFT_405946 [Selaginella moellendorffii]